MFLRGQLYGRRLWQGEIATTFGKEREGDWMSEKLSEIIFYVAGGVLGSGITIIILWKLGCIK
jgi:hypothetical protein